MIPPWVLLAVVAVLLAVVALLCFAMSRARTAQSILCECIADMISAEPKTEPIAAAARERLQREGLWLSDR